MKNIYQILQEKTLRFRDNLEFLESCLLTQGFEKIEESDFYLLPYAQFNFDKEIKSWVTIYKKPFEIHYWVGYSWDEDYTDNTYVIYPKKLNGQTISFRIFSSIYYELKNSDCRDEFCPGSILYIETKKQFENLKDCLLEFGFKMRQVKDEVIFYLPYKLTRLHFYVKYNIRENEISYLYENLEYGQITLPFEAFTAQEFFKAIKDEVKYMLN